MQGMRARAIAIAFDAPTIAETGSFTLAAYRLVKQNLFTQTVVGGAIDQVGQRSAQGVEATLDLDLGGGFGLHALRVEHPDRECRSEEGHVALRGAQSSGYATPSALSS